MATSATSTGASASSTPPPAGTTWTGDWDERFGDRVYGADPVPIGPVAALLTGLQHRDGSTVSGVALRVEGVIIGAAPESAVAADLTPTQARELADALTALADRAEALDGLS
jgi:hypothetical protein